MNADTSTPTELEVALAEVDSPEAEATPDSILTEWATDQRGWVRRLVRLVAETGEPLGPTEIQRLTQSALIECGAVAGPCEAPLAVEVGELADDPADALTILGIEKINGVNALVADAWVAFNNGLTVVFGENGSGKTGLSRLIKRAAGERNAEEILHNVREGEQLSEPSACFQIEVAGQPDSVEWKNEHGIDPLTAIRVFDSKSVELHVDQELKYLVSPSSLMLFKYVLDGLDDVQTGLKGSAQQYAPPADPLSTGFTAGSPVHDALERLKENRDLSALEALAKLTDEDSELLKQLRSDLAGLNEASLDQQLVTNLEDARHLRRLAEIIELAKSFEPEAYNGALGTLGESVSEHARLRAELFDAAELPGDPDEEWQAFIEAGRDYRVHVGLDHELQEGEKCVYCMQELSADARELIAKYGRLLDETLAQRIQKEKEELEKVGLKIDQAELKTVATGTADRLEVNEKDALMDEARRFLEDVEAACALVLKEEAVGELLDADRVVELELRVSAELTRLAELKVELDRKKGDQEGARKDLSARIAPLADRELLSQKLPDIRAAMINEALFEALNSEITAISKSTKTGLTNAAKSATKAVLNGEFEKLFQAECGALRAPEVGLTFPGGEAATKRKKRVAGTHAPSRILSEGELKSLALADFIAECRMTSGRGPLVFDDPVSSLDHRRITEVASRLLELAAEFQVIVFTHNVWFVAELLDKAGKGGAGYCEVASDGKVNGIVENDANPRYDSPATIGKRINTILNSGESLEPAIEEALAREGYGLIRAWCEAFVEQELLGDVVRRFRDNIMLSKLDKINGSLIDEAHALIDPIYDKSSGYMLGHAQTMDQSGTRPTLKELAEDFHKLTDFRKAMIAS